MQSSVIERHYCYLCERTHSHLITALKCPECGNVFCKDSIEESRKMGMNKCAYCQIEPYDCFNYVNQEFIPIESSPEIEDLFKNREYYKPTKEKYNEVIFPIDIELKKETEESVYTQIFVVVNGVSKTISVPSMFVEEIKNNNDVIDEHIARKIEIYENYVKEQLKKYSDTVDGFADRSIDRWGNLIESTEPKNQFWRLLFGSLLCFILVWSVMTFIIMPLLGLLGL